MPAVTLNGRRQAALNDSLIRRHYEGMEGGGTPDGLFAGALPPTVRILSIDDVIDALTSDRRYRRGLPHDLSVSILRKEASNGSLDPELVELFCKLANVQVRVQDAEHAVSQ